MSKLTKIEIVTILDRIKYSKTVTPLGSVWEIHSNDLPEFIEMEVRNA